MTCLERIFYLGIIVASLGCGKPVLQQKPQLVVDREAFGLKVEFGAAYIGTAPTASISIKNEGLEDLVIQSATYSGDQAFVASGPLETTVKGKDTTFMQIIFTPTAEKTYSGTLVIVSNAEDNPATKSTPTKTLAITGRGLDGGR